MIRVVDLSSVQGIISDDCWQHLVDLGIRGAYVKCTTGNDGADPDFATNVAGARRHNIAVGPYHFAYPLPDDGVHKTRAPAAQAALFRGHANGVGCAPGDMPPATDLEWPVPEDMGKWNCTPQQVCAWALDCLDDVAKCFGRDPVVYTYPYWASAEHLELYPTLGAYPLWLADYASYPHTVPPDGAKPRAELPWKAATLWQHTGGGMNLPNGQPVDYSVFMGDEAAWQAFLGLS